MIIRAAAIAATAAFAVLTAQTSAEAQTMRLKASVFAPATNPLTLSMEAWGAHLKEKSGGRLTLKVFAASQMGPPPRQFDLARTGVADVAIVGHFLTPGRFPLSELTNLPGVLTASDYVSALALSQIAQETLGAEHPGVRIIAVGVNTPINIISKMPIKAPADFKGRRIRTTGATQADLLSAIGAVPTSTLPGEMNDAIGKGMIDGAGTAYAAIAGYQLVDVAKSITEGPFGSVTFVNVMSSATYDKLPNDLKAVVDGSRATAAQLMARALSDDEAKHRAGAIAKGATIVPFADDGSVAKASGELREKAIAAAKAKGLDAAGFLAKLEAAVAQNKGAK